MSSCVDFTQLNDADVGINLRGVEPGMPKQLLNEPDVRAVLQHVRRARVPEQVATALVADARRIDRAADPVADVLIAEPLAVARQELGPLLGANFQPGPRLFQVAAQPMKRMFAQRHDTVFLALPLPDREQAALAVEVVEVQPDQFTAPDAGGVERLEDRPIPYPQRIGHVGHVQDGQHFSERERTRQGLGGLAG